MREAAPAGYDAAVGGAVILDRSRRVQWSFTGRAPLDMLKGVVTGRIPHPPAAMSPGILAGESTYHAVLTPKGRMIADLEMWLEPGPDGQEVRADVPAAAAPTLREHLAKILPPRFARLEDRSEVVKSLTVAGPDAADLVSRMALGLRVEAADLERLPEGGYLVVGQEAGPRITVMRTGDLSVPAYELFAAPEDIPGLRAVLVAGGGAEAGEELREVLRLERGRPAFGTELGPDVIPVEAGIHHRAVDYAKGCYTGQEVIVRIRDRGRVNRHLRLLRLPPGEDPPAPGTPLLAGGREVGAVTSSALSPRQGALALGYVRREVEPGDFVAVGGPDGVLARVEEIPDP